MTSILTTIIRQAQGEQRGMGSNLKQLRPPDQRALELSLFSPAISVRQEVRLADVSFWQADIDFVKMNQLLDGVIIRAGQRNWVDVRWNENWQKARTAGIPRGSYWFYDSRETPKRQAQIWSSLLAGDQGELVHAADFEESYGGAYSKPIHFQEFLNWFQDFTLLPDDRLAIYTGYYYWIGRVPNGDPFFRRFPLWLAWYGYMDAVRVPAPWRAEDLLLWQYTSSGDGLLYGVSSKEIDLNWFCCDKTYYIRRFHLDGSTPTTPIPPPPNNGGTGMYKGVTTQVAKIWKEPGKSQIDQLPANKIVRGDAPVGDYVYLHEPVKGYTKKVWLKDYKPETTTPTNPPPPPPPPPDPDPDPTPTVTLKHVIDVFSDGSIRIDGHPYP